MRFKLRSLLVSAACLVAGGPALADTLFQQLPADAANSQQSDDNGTPIWTQSWPALSNATLDKIVWWGQLGANSLPGATETMEVFLGGVKLTGTLTTSPYVFSPGSTITMYTLDIPDVALTATELGIWNTNLDAEWFWFGAAGENAPGVAATAFRLEGKTDNGTVPEPGALALLGLAGAGLFAARRRHA